MRRLAGWIGLFVVLLLGLGFAVSNAGRQVTIDLGIFTLYRVPITFVAFGGMVVGMGVVLIAGINADLKVRAILQDRSSAAGEDLAGPTQDDSLSPTVPELERPLPTTSEQLPLPGELPLE